MTRLLPIFLVIFFSQTLIAAEGPSVLSYPEEYRYQSSLYLFLTGNYLSSSKLSNEFLTTTLKDRDRAALLLRLSDIKLWYTIRDYPSFTPDSHLTNKSELLRLLDVLYRMQDYENSLLVSRELGNWGAANYFEGISLLNLDRLEDSRLTLEQISEDDIFYPYARIFLAQIEVMKHNLNGAQAYLEGLLSHPSMTGDLADRVHILLGDILFERGNFSDALNEFLMVSFNSLFYRETLIGQAWSLTKMGQCINAVAVIEAIMSDSIYDTIDQDAKIIFGYCYLKMGRFQQAFDYFQTLLETLSATEKRLEDMSKDRNIRERYVSILIDKGFAPLTTEERLYLSILSSDDAISNNIEEHRLFNTLRLGFKDKEKEVIDKETYIENMINGLEEMLKKRDNAVKKIRDILFFTNKRMSKGVSIQTTNITFFAGIEEGIYDFWQQTLRRDIADDTKRLIRFILQEWTYEGLKECFNSPIVCHIVSFLSVEGTRERHEQVQEIVRVVEMIGKDLISVQAGHEIEFEKALATNREKAEQSIKKGRKALSKLKWIKEELKRHISDSENASKESLNRLDTYIMNKFIKLKYELGDFKTNIIAGSNAAVKGMEENKQEAIEQK